MDRSGLKEVGQKLIADPKAVPLQHVEQQLRNLVSSTTKNKQAAILLKSVLSHAVTSACVKPRDIVLFDCHVTGLC